MDVGILDTIILLSVNQEVIYQNKEDTNQKQQYTRNKTNYFEEHNRWFVAIFEHEIV